MLKNQCNQPDSKTYEVVGGQCSFGDNKSGGQPSLSEMSAKASPAISKGLPRLSELLSAQGIQINSFDELYTAAVNIIKFVACKERRATIANQEEK